MKLSKRQIKYLVNYAKNNTKEESRMASDIVQSVTQQPQYKY